MPLMVKINVAPRGQFCQKCGSERVKVRLVLNAVSATWAILRRPILVAFYDTHGDTEDTFST